jgi:hypothetical protein
MNVKYVPTAMSLPSTAVPDSEPSKDEDYKGDLHDCTAVLSSGNHEAMKQ